jgi:predicted nucleotidyltransferase
MLDSKQILIYLSSNKDRFKKDYHLIRIGVFGSVARGEQNENSDIDLVVEFEENTPDLYTVKQRLRDEIQSKFNTQVDICREKYIKPIFKKLVLSEVKYA